MFESFIAVPLHFTVEFLGFLVAAGAGLLVLSRPVLIPGSASNRIAASLGFGALAVAQVAHGGSFLETDGNKLLVGLTTLGLALILIGVVGGLRPAVPASVVLDDPLLLTPAVAAVLLALMSYVEAVRAGPRFMRRLSLGALLLGGSSVLVAFAPDAEFGLGKPNVYLYSAHALKALSFLALGAWLWTGVRSSISSRFVVSFAALLVAVVLALSTALTGVISSNVEEEGLQRVAGQLRNAVHTIEEEETSALLGDVKQLAQNPVLKTGMAEGSDLEPLASEIYTSGLFPVQFAVLIDRRGSKWYAGEGPAKFRNGDPKVTNLWPKQVVRIIGSEVVVEVLAGGSNAAASLDRIGDSALAIVAAAAVPDPDRPRRTVGYVAIGSWVDAFTLEDISASLDPASASLLVGGDIVLSALPPRIQRQERVPASLEALLQRDELVTRKSAFERSSYFEALTAFEDDRDVPIPAGLMLSAPAEIVSETRAEVTRILFLVALGAGAIVLVLAWVSGRRITHPIQVLTAAAMRVREGDLDARAEVHGEDEVGQLGETFNEMTAALGRMTNDLREAAREEHGLRARIETIIESMADALVAVNAEKKILAFNREAENLTGIRAEDAVGRPIDEIIDARDAQGMPASLPINSLQEGSVTGVFVGQRGGDRIPVDVTSAVLRTEDDELAGGVAVLRDMSREREIERMKSEFLSNISHELRTPLTPIKGYAEILGRKDVPVEKTKQFAKGILESTARLERIVGLLVDFSAMEAGRLLPRAAPVDVADLVTDLAAQWDARSPRHSFSVEIESGLPQVLGDERLLRRSLDEVLDNAVKFSPDGGTIELRARNGASGRDASKFVELSITDEGIGILPEDLPGIFSDFHQLDGSETRAYGGLGLGLAFVQRIVEAHDGSIGVESEPDRGTRLTISLPASKEEPVRVA